MFDRFNRKINYLRISLTDRCNLACTYCMPDGDIKHIPNKDVLTLNEVVEIVKKAAKLGIDKVRLTGGEPLLRNDIVEMCKKLKSIEGINELSLTTNGIFLNKYAKQLKNAGLDRVNISLDTLNPDKYKQITKHGNLQDVLKGIEAATEADLKPVKINFVRLKGINDEDEHSVKEFCKSKGLKIRFIQQMDLTKGVFAPVEGATGGICSQCNRLRITSDKKIKPCLHSDISVEIKNKNIEKGFAKALYLKPEKGTSCKSHEFYNIGG